MPRFHPSNPPVAGASNWVWERVEQTRPGGAMSMSVAVLGTGIMGSGMAKNLIKAGFDVTVWNRHREKAEPLAEAGAKIAGDPKDAVAEADVVLTMLFDTDAVEGVMGEALPAMREDAVWIQSSTVGLPGVARLAERAGYQGIAFVDAPVLGTKQPAEEGKLLVLAGGPEDLRERVQPVFDAIGSKTVWVGELPGDGHKLKLVANSWVLSIVGATAQAIDLMKRFGLDPQLYLDTIAGGVTDCAYAQLKGKAMIAGEFPPSFPLTGAAKDAQLIAEAMDHVGTRPVIMEALAAQFRDAIDGGHGSEDMASVIAAFDGGGQDRASL
ncbi:NAD(P)-dependent oxidoreductase [Sinomonas humi]|nr:NAD(P)-dependent oxidoreductase [Sinomonas humi]